MPTDELFFPALVAYTVIMFCLGFARGWDTHAEKFGRARK